MKKLKSLFIALLALTSCGISELPNEAERVSLFQMEEAGSKY